jgi:hypothetical protein
MATQDQWIKLITPNSTEIGIPLRSDDLKIVKGMEPVPDVGHRQVRALKEGRTVGEGGVSFTDLRPEDGFGELLYALFGQVSSSSIGATAVRHTFTPVSMGTELPEYTIVKNIGAVQEKYENVKINELRISTPATGAVDVDFSIVSKSASKTTGESEASYDDSPIFHSDEGVVQIDNTAYDVGNIDLRFTNNVADGRETFAIDGTTGRATTPEGDFGLELSLDVIANDTTMIDSLLDGTKVDVNLTLTSSTNIEGSTPYRIELPLLTAQVMTRGKASKVEGGVIIEDVSLLALYDTTGDNPLCTATVDNSISSYPR